jgi:hypothetical protein
MMALYVISLPLSWRAAALYPTVPMDRMVDVPRSRSLRKHAR